MPRPKPNTIEAKLNRQRRNQRYKAKLREHLKIQAKLYYRRKKLEQKQKYLPEGDKFVCGGDCGSVSIPDQTVREKISEEKTRKKIDDGYTPGDGPNHWEN
jgi:hypothetical protein